MRRPDHDYPALVTAAPPDPGRQSRVRALAWFVFGSVSTLAVLAVMGVLP
ncbi:MAG TPA: hypothetical protein VJ140_07805 [Actinomycetota bacterium]|nr:hypothetical protein [Actinomycetota bacterium]